ncbi:MAG: sulfite exporter TauE/SafE family protein, partial [Proteobacteria bacterium]|nr:sulfite exporter TauE/SafE family protein [Pseudomonadota bacterium]
MPLHCGAAGVITDLSFYLAAIPAVTALGISKGGFSGLGLMAVPLLSLVMPPLQAAGVLLPILIVQDMVTVWAFRRTWDGWNLRVMLPGSAIGVGAGWL